MKSIKTWGKHKYKAGRFLFCRLICLIISFLSAWFLWTEDKYSRWKYCLSSGKNVFFWLRYLTNDLFLRVSFLISRIPRFSLRLTRSNKRKIYRNFFFHFMSISPSDNPYDVGVYNFSVFFHLTFHSIIINDESCQEDMSQRKYF